MKLSKKFNARTYFKTGIKRQISLILCMVMLIASGIPVFADNHKINANISVSFSDVKEDFWAYSQIMWMLGKNIISGKGDNTFDPNGTVTRAEFAKMMVNTLNLETYSPDTASFIDVSKSNWAYKYVETAKKFLTGFRTTSGDNFKPSQSAVREDMAVALVKALGYDKETIDENTYLSRFSDASQISSNLRKYVALAVKHELISGYTENGVTTFKAQGNLTRAEAATLLQRVYQANEEKITYDEDKVTYDGETYTVPKIIVIEENGKLKLSWNAISSDKLQGYKVVISKKDSTPQFLITVIYTI